MKKLLIVGAVLVIGYLIFKSSQAEYNAFSARRDDWQRRCLAYVGSKATVVDPVREASCSRELAELLAYAQSKGWTKP